MGPSRMSTPPLPDMDELIQRLLDDQIEPDEMERLQKAILQDQCVRDYYIDSLIACAVVRRSSQTTGELSKSDLMRSLSGQQACPRTRQWRHLLRALAAIVAFGVLLVAGLSLFRHKARGPAVANLVGQFEARWKGQQLRQGDLLAIGHYELLEGLAKLELKEGVEIILEAPCQFELASQHQIRLRRGLLTAVVPVAAKGFQVQTPTALITDLGTEFGVLTYPDGTTEAHVLKGRIAVALDHNRTGLSTRVVVNEGSAAAVDGSTIKADLVARPELFTLDLPSPAKAIGPTKRLNLADIVGGGNGHGTGRLDRGIDLVTGLPFDGPATVIRLSLQNQFRPIPFNRWIDGVFVPNAAKGPVVISSTRLVFTDCPRTMGTYYGGPTNSGRFYDIPTRQVRTALLRGIRYGTSAHPALNLHPNAGITFDLDRIREDNPDIKIGRFTAVCGIPRDLPQPQFSDAEVWILLDGVVVLHLRYPVGASPVYKVDIPIPAQTRFLTLVSTCLGRADYSWILFGDPFLVPAADQEGQD